MPRDKRRYVHALYAYARAADDFADEPMYEGMRAEKLDQWEARLHAAYEGRAEDPIFIALAETVRALDIPKALLLDLLSAFRQDTVKQRYETWDELLDYCRRSADPVGRLVLLVFGYRDPELFALSDRSAPRSSSRTTGRTSPSTSHRGRIYAPRELRERYGVKEWDLNAGRVTPEFAALMARAGRAHARALRARPAAVRPRWAATCASRCA